MKLSEILLFILLSAIWGSSFIFMRLLAPVIGPFSTTGLRLFIAGAFLVVIFLITGHKLDWKKNWRKYLLIGVVNSGIPFTLLSIAALSQSASVSAVVNSMTPIWGAVFAAIFLKDPFTLGKAGGLILGVAGVAIIGFFGKQTNIETSGVALAACTLASICYAAGGVYVKKHASSIPPRSIAAGSQFAAGVLFLPYMIAVPPVGVMRFDIAIPVLVFALMCSALAYLIYYRLMASIGPTKALAVTYVVPVFGFLWGRIFLKELITWPMLAGGAVIFSGIFLINRKAKNPVPYGNRQDYAVILVYNIHHALKGETALLDGGIPCKLIPTPRRISSDCGVCLRIDGAAIPEAKRLLQDAQCLFKEIVELKR